MLCEQIPSARKPAGAGCQPSEIDAGRQHLDGAMDPPIAACSRNIQCFASRQRLQAPPLRVQGPCCHDGLSARLIEEAGTDCRPVYAAAACRKAAFRPCLLVIRARNSPASAGHQQHQAPCLYMEVANTSSAMIKTPI